LWRTFACRTDQTVLHHAGIQECPYDFQQSLIVYPLGQVAHQLVVVDPVEELLQVNVHNPAIALLNILLATAYRLMSTTAGTKPVAVLREHLVPILLQHLHNRLLNKAIQNGGNTKLANPAAGLGYFYSLDRLRAISARK